MVKIKIFVGYHKPSGLIKNEVFQPILLGSSLRKDEDIKFFEGCSYDNNGENISYKNNLYSELTGLYNIWKNPNIYTNNFDYIGFIHYRRILNFGSFFSKLRLSWYTKAVVNFINKNKPDLIIPQKSKIFSKWIKNDNIKHNLGIKNEEIIKITQFKNISMKAHFEKVHNKEDFYEMMSAIKNLYPDVYKVAVKSVEKEYAYFFNMFIAKKEIFNQIMSFVFSVIEIIEKNRNSWKDEFYKNPYQSRVAGFISERLMSIYIDYLYSKDTYNISEKKMLMVDVESCKLIYKQLGYLK